MADRKRCCCNCRRNIRTGNPGEVTCHCEIDGHYISYVMAFDGWCRRWARETKWDKEKSERVLELYGKLKPYADAEEQGRLVILPFDMKGIKLVVAERELQIDLWGDQSGNHPFDWMAILGEEYGELCEAVNETCFQNPKHPERGGKDNIVKEAVHVAAVAVAIAEAALKGDSNDV